MLKQLNIGNWTLKKILNTTQSIDPAVMGLIVFKIVLKLILI